MKKTVINLVESAPDGTLHIRFAKQVLADDGTVISSSWHRTAIPPGGNVDLQMAAVNRNLIVDLGYPPVEQADIDLNIKARLPEIWTDAVKTKYRERQALAKTDSPPTRRQLTLAEELQLAAINEQIAKARRDEIEAADPAAAPAGAMPARA